MSIFPGFENDGSAKVMFCGIGQDVVSIGDVGSRPVILGKTKNSVSMA